MRLLAPRSGIQTVGYHPTTHYLTRIPLASQPAVVSQRDSRRASYAVNVAIIRLGDMKYPGRLDGKTLFSELENSDDLQLQRRFNVTAPRPQNDQP